MTTNFLEMDIRWDEAPNGEPVLNAYPDPLTHGPPWTIGFGSTGAGIHEGTVWTKEQAQDRLAQDISEAKSLCAGAWTWWSSLSDPRQDVLVMMVYQMGFQGVEKFVNTLASIAAGRWEDAAERMRSSRWYTQTPRRAERLIEQMRRGVRLPTSHDPMLVIQVSPQPSPEPTFMSLISSAFHFVFDHAFAAAARQAATADPNAVAGGIVAVQSTPMPAEGTSNSPAGVANPLIKQLEDDLNALVATFVKSAVDQLPGVGGIAEVTGLDQKAADAAKAMLVFGEQHALTYLSALFSGHHLAVSSVTQGSNNAP